MKERYSLEDFIEIIRVLRGEQGCPWDKVQTHESLRESMLEEAYEAVDAIDKNDMKNLCEELGDVLMQVIFHAEIEREKGGFTIEDVYDGISKKMISRHRHIFADDEAKTCDEVLKNWEQIKREEKELKTHTQVLENVAKALPALTRAYKIQKKAADAGFDFANVKETILKLKEEIAELEDVLENCTAEKERIQEEYGDILFSAVNISRFLNINPEYALTNSSEKFINRFRYVEETALLRGKTPVELTSEQMDELWELSKNITNFFKEEKQ